MGGYKLLTVFYRKPLHLASISGITLAALADILSDNYIYYQTVVTCCHPVSSWDVQPKMFMVKLDMVLLVGFPAVTVAIDQGMFILNHVSTHVVASPPVPAFGRVLTTPNQRIRGPPANNQLPEVWLSSSNIAF